MMAVDGACSVSVTMVRRPTHTITAGRAGGARRQEKHCMGTIVGYYTPGLYEHEARRLAARWNASACPATWSRSRTGATRARISASRAPGSANPGAVPRTDPLPRRRCLRAFRPWAFLATLRRDVGVYYHFRTLLSGTILLNDTPGCRLVLDRWASLCQSRRPGIKACWPTPFAAWPKRFHRSLAAAIHVRLRPHARPLSRLGPRDRASSSLPRWSIGGTPESRCGPTEAAPALRGRKS